MPRLHCLFQRPFAVAALLLMMMPVWSACSSLRTTNESSLAEVAVPVGGATDTSSHTPRMRATPGTCRIIGTIMAIDPELQSASPKQPCANAPCKATVRVDSVLRRGAEFKGDFSAGSIVEMNFAFTLRPTSEVMPHLKDPYPGLDVGSRFEAEVRPVVAPPSNKGGRLSVTMSAPFVVYDYIRF